MSQQFSGRVRTATATTRNPNGATPLGRRFTCASGQGEQGPLGLSLDALSRGRRFVDGLDEAHVLQSLFTRRQRLLVVPDAVDEVIHLRGEVVDDRLDALLGLRPRARAHLEA